MTNSDTQVEEQPGSESAGVESEQTEAATPKEAAEPIPEDQGANAEADNTDSDRVIALEAMLEEARQKAAEASDQALRTVADMQNLRKRTERDVESAHKFGQEKLVSSLLPVLDNLDRALDSSAGVDAESAGAEALAAMREGVELTRKTAQDALQKFSVEILEPVGEPFDPEFHEAMSMIPSDTAEPNTVLEVLQKGYTLNGRLLRAAMVVVSK